jgi:hypothetical protein
MVNSIALASIVAFDDGTGTNAGTEIAHTEIAG